MSKNYDFSGWATKNDLRCSDGVIIRENAFKDNDGDIVPLVWNHRHEDPENVLGHAELKNCEEGVYAYCKLNDTHSGRTAKELIKHGDISSLSIYANKLTRRGSEVLHGKIREVSLCLSGMNPGATIDSVVMHSDDADAGEEAIIYTGETIDLYHSEDSSESEKPKEEPDKKDTKKTVGDVLKTFTPEQRDVLNFLVGEALYEEAPEDDKDKDKDETEEAKHSEDEHTDDVLKQSNDYTEGDDSMSRNLFENGQERATISHADMTKIINDAKRYGSLKESFLQHKEDLGIEDITYLAHSSSIEYAEGKQPYGVNDPSFLFPEARSLNTPPEFIKRKDDWVSVVMGGVHHTPFSRIKSMFADITADEARAKGYIKGKLKKEEVFSLLKRVTEPVTVYKKQKMDRDDIIDITDFDVIAWLKGEMRMMLDEELARAFIFGDGRLASSEDKIDENHIRPIVSDEDLFTIKVNLEPGEDEEPAKAFIDTAIRSRKNYRGSGTPTLFAGEDIITEMLLLEDGIGHKMYKTEAELATALRVNKVVHVPDEVMPEGVLGVFVNLNDYNVGADKGGAISMFDDFDIDYNQQKYLIETRCSGALTKPYSAIVIRRQI